MKPTSTAVSPAPDSILSNATDLSSTTAFATTEKTNSQRDSPATSDHTVATDTVSPVVTSTLPTQQSPANQITSTQMFPTTTLLANQTTPGISLPSGWFDRYMISTYLRGCLLQLQTQHNIVLLILRGNSLIVIFSFTYILIIVFILLGSVNCNISQLCSNDSKKKITFCPIRVLYLCIFVNFIT